MRKKSTSIFVRRCLLAASLGIGVFGNANAQSFNITAPDGAANVAFGTSLAVLPNGNIVVVDPKAANGAVLEAGAVYLISGITYQVISTLRGSTANDHIGNQGITVLANGNFVVASNEWDNGSLANAGAVTWGSGTTGVSGVVSSSNSMVGPQAQDNIGLSGVYPLSNGNYVMCNTVWKNGTAINAGAVTWCSGTAASSGLVGPSNSLCGTKAQDVVGTLGIRELTNGNYVVGNLYWDNGTTTNAGAVTWCNGTTGRTGYVSSTNSLVGTHTDDMIGQILKPLANGNYVACGVSWQNGSTDECGAVIWCDGTTGRTGAVSASIALVGARGGDLIGNGDVTPLDNGNYIVKSPFWSNGTSTLGAFTWCDGATGTTGVVSAANSIVGSSASNPIGNGQVYSLPNGNYVYGEAGWNAGTGIAAFLSGTAPTSGTLSAANALTGAQQGDYVGGEVTVLSNGNYVVSTPNWSSPTQYGLGAVTWCSGTTGRTGVVSAANSLVGGIDGDNVGSKVIALANGNYVVGSPQWSSANHYGCGAATWCDGTTGRIGTVTASNSVIGSGDWESVGDRLVALTNGSYALSAPSWDNSRGAVCILPGNAATARVISAGNSLTGSTTSDALGSDLEALPDGGLVVHDGYSNNMVGLQTLINGAASPVGPISTCNTVRGTAANGGPSQQTSYRQSTGTLFVGRRADNVVTVIQSRSSTISQNNDQALASINAVGQKAELSDNANCRVVAAVNAGGALPVTGEISAKAIVRSTAGSYNGEAYVRRSYDITPVLNAGTATARLTLYFTQADFDNYNTNNGTAPDLPTSDLDLTGKANLRVTQQHGTSATGEPGSYSGFTGTGPANVSIDPSDADIVWNGSLSRWEVSFDVVGFSGFFVHGSLTATPLNLQLLRFDAKAAGAANRVEWTLSNTATATELVLERSADGSRFEPIATIRPDAGTDAYEFLDQHPLSPVSHYRLRYADLRADARYSGIASVRRGTSAGSVSVSPVPADQQVTIRTTSPGLLGSTATVLDMHGRNMQVITLGATTQIDVSSWPSGVYTLRLADGSSLRIVRK